MRNDLRKSTRSFGDGKRLYRVSEEVRRKLAIILSAYTPTHSTQEIRLTISEVQMSKDLRQARVYVVPLQMPQISATDHNPLLTQLNHEAFALQKLLAARVALKFTPRLRFYIDTAFETASTLQRTFSKLQHTRTTEPPFTHN